MRSTLTALLLFLLTLNLTSCGSGVDEALAENQALLEEADLYLEFGQLREAKENTSEAIQSLNLLVAKSPSNVDYLLLHARALITEFLITNSSVISSAKVLPKSLMQIPSKSDYINYDRYIAVALSDLKKAAEIGEPLPDDKRAALHSMLAGIYRLRMKTMREANVEYKIAIKSYRSYLSSLHRDKNKIGGHGFKIQQITNQIRQLDLARAEVKIAQHKWKMALKILKKIAGGDSLSYFDLQFSKLENKLAELTRLINSKEPKAPKRVGAIKDLVMEKRDLDSKAKQIAGSSTYEVNRLQAEIELTWLKNNLLYRIICYRWLNDTESYTKARSILREYYPDLDHQLNTLLKK